MKIETASETRERKPYPRFLVGLPFILKRGVVTSHTQTVIYVQADFFSLKAAYLIMFFSLKAACLIVFFFLL